MPRFFFLSPSFHQQMGINLAISQGCHQAGVRMEQAEFSAPPKCPFLRGVAKVASWDVTSISELQEGGLGLNPGCANYRLGDLG